MVLAIVYDKETGNIGEHFGHAPFFKLYELENGQIIDQAVVSPFGQGHEAVVYTLQEYSVTMVFCANIGEGAIEGLKEAGIQVVPGLEGNADEKVAEFLDGKISIPISYSSNCGQHEHEGGCCDASSCGAGCGGCCH